MTENTPRSGRLLVKLLGACVLLTLAGAGGLWWYAGQLTARLDAPLSSIPEVQVLTVKPGTSLRKLIVQLEAEGLLSGGDDLYLALRIVRWRGLPVPLPKAGEFEVQADWSLNQLLGHLATGRVKTYKITVPEGLRIGEIAERLGQSPLIDAQTVRTLTRDERFADALGVPPLPRAASDHPNGERFEGWLFPTTYTLTRATSERKLLTTMVRHTQSVLAEPEVIAGMERLGWTTHQVLSLAAVIEKETAQASERPIISAVFHNRLRKGMKLQTDPTIIYGLTDYAGNIRRRHILSPHPWNTYVHRNLPITPIAAAGAEAIRAALNPAQSDALFFVSRNDKTHVFCPTLSCHNRAVKKWQIDYFRKKRGR
jgi:UPF0755 protein